MVILEKLNFITETSVILGGEAVATAKIEQTKAGTLVIHIDMTGKPVDILTRGFSLGEFTVPEVDE